MISYSKNSVKFVIFYFLIIFNIPIIAVSPGQGGGCQDSGPFYVTNDYGIGYISYSMQFGQDVYPNNGDEIHINSNSIEFTHRIDVSQSGKVPNENYEDSARCYIEFCETEEFSSSWNSCGNFGSVFGLYNHIIDGNPELNTVHVTITKADCPDAFTSGTHFWRMKCDITVNGGSLTYEDNTIYSHDFSYDITNNYGVISINLLSGADGTTDCYNGETFIAKDLGKAIIPSTADHKLLDFNVGFKVYDNNNNYLGECWCHTEETSEIGSYSEISTEKSPGLSGFQCENPPGNVVDPQVDSQTGDRTFEMQCEIHGIPNTQDLNGAYSVVPFSYVKFQNKHNGDDIDEDEKEGIREPFNVFGCPGSQSTPSCFDPTNPYFGVQCGLNTKPNYLFGSFKYDELRALTVGRMEVKENETEGNRIIEVTPKAFSFYHPGYYPLKNASVVFIVEYKEEDENAPNGFSERTILCRANTYDDGTIKANISRLLEVKGIDESFYERTNAVVCFTDNHNDCAFKDCVLAYDLDLDDKQIIVHDGYFNGAQRCDLIDEDIILSPEQSSCIGDKAYIRFKIQGANTGNTGGGYGSGGSLPVYYTVQGGSGNEIIVTEYPTVISVSRYSIFTPISANEVQNSAYTVNLCLPVILLFGLLFASMYATGNNPFFFFDLTRVGTAKALKVNYRPGGGLLRSYTDTKAAKLSNAVKKHAIKHVAKVVDKGLNKIGLNRVLSSSQGTITGVLGNLAKGAIHKTVANAVVGAITGAALSKGKGMKAIKKAPVGSMLKASVTSTFDRSFLVKSLSSMVVTLFLKYVKLPGLSDVDEKEGDKEKGDEKESEKSEADETANNEKESEVSEKKGNILVSAFKWLIRKIKEGFTHPGYKDVQSKRIAYTEIYSLAMSSLVTSLLEWGSRGFSKKSSKYISMDEVASFRSNIGYVRGMAQLRILRTEAETSLKDLKEKGIVRINKEGRLEFDKEKLKEAKKDKEKGLDLASDLAALALFGKLVGDIALQSLISGKSEKDLKKQIEFVKNKIRNSLISLNNGKKKATITYNDNGVKREAIVDLSDIQIDGIFGMITLKAKVKGTNKTFTLTLFTQSDGKISVLAGKGFEGFGEAFTNFIEKSEKATSVGKEIYGILDGMKSSYSISANALNSLATVMFQMSQYSLDDKNLPSSFKDAYNLIFGDEKTKGLIDGLTPTSSTYDYIMAAKSIESLGMFFSVASDAVKKEENNNKSVFDIAMDMYKSAQKINSEKMFGSGNLTRAEFLANTSISYTTREAMVLFSVLGFNVNEQAQQYSKVKGFSELVAFLSINKRFIKKDEKGNVVGVDVDALLQDKNLIEYDEKKGEIKLKGELAELSQDAQQLIKNIILSSKGGKQAQLAAKEIGVEEGNMPSFLESVATTSEDFSNKLDVASLYMSLVTLGYIKLGENLTGKKLEKIKKKYNISIPNNVTVESLSNVGRSISEKIKEIKQKNGLLAQFIIQRDGDFSTLASSQEFRSLDTQTMESAIMLMKLSASSSTSAVYMRNFKNLVLFNNLNQKYNSMDESEKKRFESFMKRLSVPYSNSIQVGGMEKLYRDSEAALITSREAEAGGIYKPNYSPVEDDYAFRMSGLLLYTTLGEYADDLVDYAVKSDPSLDFNASLVRENVIAPLVSATSTGGGILGYGSKISPTFSLVDAASNLVVKPTALPTKEVTLKIEKPKEEPKPDIVSTEAKGTHWDYASAYLQSRGISSKVKNEKVLRKIHLGLTFLFSDPYVKTLESGGSAEHIEGLKSEDTYSVEGTKTKSGRKEDYIGGEAIGKQIFISDDFVNKNLFGESGITVKDKNGREITLKTLQDVVEHADSLSSSTLDEIFHLKKDSPKFEIKYASVDDGKTSGVRIKVLSAKRDDSSSKNSGSRKPRK